MFKTIPDTNGLYEASEAGEVRRVGGRCLSPKTKKNGYMEVALHLERGEQTSRYVHRLVASAWLGVIPHKMVVNHKDANKSNNSLTNLEVVTASENMKHAYENGLNTPPSAVGESNPRATTNEREVKKIRKEHEQHKSVVRLMDDYPHLTKHTLTGIVYYKSWKHLSEEVTD